jgi:hypothetical protein
LKKLKTSNLEKSSKTGHKNRKTTENRKPEEKTRANQRKPPETEENLRKKYIVAANGLAHLVRHFRRERIAPAMSGE